ncbi:MAG: NUDIX hydrolase, partial [Bacteroidota bacterium]
FLQQFHTFGKAARYFPEQVQSIVDRLGIDPEDAKWFFQRFVSVGYYALVQIEKVEPKVDLFTEGFEWANVDDLPPLIMDHQEMIYKAKAHLKNALHNQPVALQLLPSSFTLPELQGLYEIILDRTIDRRNFRKKILASKTLVQLDEQRKTPGHRAPNVYRFDEEAYCNSLGEKSKLGF